MCGLGQGQGGGLGMPSNGFGMGQPTPPGLNNMQPPGLNHTQPPGLNHLPQMAPRQNGGPLPPTIQPPPGAQVISDPGLGGQWQHYLQSLRR